MDDHSSPGAPVRDAGIGLQSACEPPAGVPWLEGSLLRYLGQGAVLDIKVPGDPNGAAIVPCAEVATWNQPDDAETGLASFGRRYDAIFSRDVLATVPDPGATLRAWFDLLSDGGHLVATLPHARSGAGRPHPVASQSRALCVPPEPGSTHKGNDAATVRRIVQSALPADVFRVLRLDEGPSRRAVAGGPPGQTEIRLVLQRIRGRAAPAVERAERVPRPVAAASIPFLLTHPMPPGAPGMTQEGNLLVRDFAPRPARVERILVLKLDHHGDFLIGLPALRELRGAFGRAHIRLICGRWNLDSARDSGVADEIRCFDYFTERAVDWNGPGAGTAWDQFAAAAAGHFDIAIDLRVDEDTRALLGRVDATLRCGIGTQARFPLLDIALPDASRDATRPGPTPPAATGADGSQMILPNEFFSEMEKRCPAYHEARFAGGERCLLRSNDVVLPAGRFSASFDLSARRFVPGLGGAGIGVEVIANGQDKIAAKVFGRRLLSRLNARLATVEFDSTGERSSYQFRVTMAGRPLSGRIRFAGLRLRCLEASGARFRPSELHVGEKLSLLVSLIRQRTLPVAPSAPAGPVLSDVIRFVIAPFSNSTVRDWPAGHYAALIDLILQRYDCTIRLVGSRAQEGQAARLLGLLPASARRDRVTSEVGKTKWADLPEILRGADLVICNNSGIAHQAAELGVRTLAIYSASHQPLEWGPRGARTRAIMMGVACSPCGFERLEECENDHLCMRLITPQAVLSQVEHLLAEAGSAGLVG